MAPKKSSKGKGVAAEPSREEGWEPNARESAGDDGRAHSASPSEDTHAGHPKGTRSTVRKRSSSSQATSNSPSAKMPRISASGEDAVVGQAVPSTTVDSSKGTGTTRLTSSSNTSDTENTGGGAVIVRPPPKFG